MRNAVPKIAIVISIWSVFACDSNSPQQNPGASATVSIPEEGSGSPVSLPEEPSSGVAQAARVDLNRQNLSPEAKQKEEFSDILLYADGAEGYRRIGDRMSQFAGRIDLQRCLEELGRGREEAVMRLRFVELVAMCEIQLGIPALTPDERWPVRG